MSLRKNLGGESHKPSERYLSYLPELKSSSHFRLGVEGNIVNCCVFLRLFLSQPNSVTVNQTTHTCQASTTMQYELLSSDVLMLHILIWERVLF